jgi:hypothetical protein
VSLASAGITNVVGSYGDDILVSGAAGANINGNGGNDLFVVDSGGDTLTAGNGTSSRFLLANGPGGSPPGGNVVHGGGNSTIDMSQAPSGVTVNLQNPNQQTATGTGAWAGAGETMTGILNIIGSRFNDQLLAGAPNSTVTGLSGQDLLEVSVYGHDTLDGSGGTGDTFCAQAGCNGMAFNPVAGSTLRGSSGDDSFYAQNGVQDVIHEGGGTDFVQRDGFDLVTNP